MAYTLYTGGPYKQNDGTAITATSTLIDKGTAKNVPDGENLTRTNWRGGVAEMPVLVGGVNGVVAADLEAGVTVSSFAEASNGLLQLTYGSAHGLVANDIVVFDGLPAYPASYRVFSVTNSTVLIINALFVTGVDAQSDIPTFKLSGTFGVQELENFIMKKHTANVHGQAETLLRTGASDKGFAKVHYMRSARVSKVTTAIRLGRYNIYNGTFSTAPTTANDYTSLDVDGTNVPDNESKALTGKREVGGAFSINAGGKSVQTKDYEAKTG